MAPRLLAGSPTVHAAEGADAAEGVGFWNPTPLRGLYIYGSTVQFLGPLNILYGPAHRFGLRSAPLSARTRKSAEKVQFRRDLRALLEMLLYEKGTQALYMALSAGFGTHATGALGF